MRAFYISIAINFLTTILNKLPTCFMSMSTWGIRILVLCTYFFACFFERLRANPNPAPSKPTASLIHALKFKASPV